MYFRG
jgi:hypothetical protein